MATGVRGGGFDFDVCSVGGLWQWRVTASNIHGAGQLYQVEDIRTPFGSLSTVDIPIPGEVVAAMAESLSTFQQQLQPKIVLTGSPAFNVTVTEGDPVLVIGSTTFVNGGAFGSFMTATGSPDSPWLGVDPPSVAGIDKNGSGSMSVRVDPRILLATASPYLGHVGIQDNASPMNLVTVPVTVTVLPRPAISVDSSTVGLSFYLASMVPGGAASITVTNSGPLGSYLSFSLAKVQNQSPWLAIAPLSGSSVPSGGAVSSTFSVVSDQVPKIPGSYTETVQIASPNASNSPQQVVVTLIVNP
jgi:hypothetical protein